MIQFLSISQIFPRCDRFVANATCIPPLNDNLAGTRSAFAGMGMKHYSIAPPDPIDAIKFRMEQMEMTNADLVKYLGSKSRVSEILNRKRNLSLSMIKSLYKELKIPADNLLA